MAEVPNGAPIRVLVVDDSVTIRAMMAQVLQAEAGIVALAARSAAEAEAVLARETIDVVTLDVEMPGENGLDYLARLVATRDVPVIMLSASTGAGAAIRARAFRLGAVGCFDKADAVRSATDLRRLVRAAAAGRARIGRADRDAMRAS